MHPVAERAKALQSDVLLTLTSIIQGLSLEVLWSSASDTPQLWTGGSAQIVAWLQVAAVFQVIVLVWLYYVHLVMRFRWVPTVRDSVVPFALGAGQFVLAETLQPEMVHLWIYAVAAVFLFAAWASVATFRSAQQDLDNAWYFSTTQYSVFDRLGPPSLTLVLLMMLAGVTQAVGSGGRWAVAAVLGVNAILLAQIWMQRGYWRRSVELRTESSAPTGAQEAPASPSRP